MPQTNYFAYNIIDALYYNQPTGDDLTNVYGIASDFVRRNPIEYEQKSPNEKAKFDADEQQFIQAVINKYVMGDPINIKVNDTFSYSYFAKVVDEETSTEYSYAYFGSYHRSHIELSDMISNINGTHNYKLMSAKDIDFDNVILPNSAITSEFNWAGFDPNRRWGNKPIYINNTFELLNVIDYLLCACDNLWNELYKIKYNVNEGVDIWFTKNVSEIESLRFANRLTSEILRVGGTGNKFITYLDPRNYYTPLNNNLDNNFGMVSNFHLIEGDENTNYDRRIMVINDNQNIIVMNIAPLVKSIAEIAGETSQNINGNLQKIYGYKIGNELKVYPGANINAFSNENYMITNSNVFVDFANKKLNYEVFFASKPEQYVYSKIYIQFLDETYIKNQSNIQGTKNPYILYFIDDNGIKQIVSYNYENSGKNICTEMNSAISTMIAGANKYHIYTLSGSTSDIQVVNTGTSIMPKFYVVPEEYSATLEVSTPNTNNYSSSTGTITIYYYKNRNKLNCTLTRNYHGQDIEILPEEDIQNNNSTAYHYFRYNIPDGETVTFNFNATYAANGNSDNPLGLKLDDEYKDVPLYDTENVSNYGSYYYYSGLNEDNNKRNFTVFNQTTFNANKTNNILTDVNNNKYKHVWMKQNNPYKINLTIDDGSFIVQSVDEASVENAKNTIINDSCITQTTYNQYKLEGFQLNDVEQVKLDLIFNIDETSKVKGAECIVPININKIYKPTINYFSYNIIKLEHLSYNYDNIELKTTGNNPQTMSLAQMYNYMNNKYGTNTPFENGINTNPKIPNIYDRMINAEHNLSDINSFDLQNRTTYDCTANNAMFEIAYNTSSYYVNLIGGWFGDMTFGATKLAPIAIKKNSGTTDLRTIDNLTLPYIFTINNLGYKYRLHGAGNNIIDNYLFSNELNTANINFTKYYTQYDLICSATPKGNSINKELQIKLTDDGHQLAYISYNTTNVWEKNNNDFNTGIDLTNNTYNIVTKPCNIIKTSYLAKCNKITISNELVSYYIPLAYIKVNNSTFYPPENAKPIDKIYNLNDISADGDVERYTNFVNCWDNTTEHYYPITLSMKLIENTSVASPYYYESNEAVMKFNILRESKSGSVAITGKSTNIYVALNSRYYLSDFLNISGIITDNDVTSGDKLPTGSYFYYNDVTHMYDIKEIYDNVGVTNDPRYKKYSGITNSNPVINDLKTNFVHPDISNNPSTIEVPYPIFRQSTTDPNTNDITYEMTSYNYDIYRIADINKINISGIYGDIVTVGQNNEEKEISLNGVQGVITDTNLSYIVFTPAFVQNFANNHNSTLDDYKYKFNMIRYGINANSFAGSMNLNGLNTSSTKTVTRILPIIRLKTNNPLNLNIYQTVQYQSSENATPVEYEFFEFMYDDICVVTNNSGTLSKKSLKPGNNMSIKAAFEEQLYYFLHSDSTKYICSETLFNTMNQQGNVIPS